ncbi:thiamine pyrophosphate-requiring enzyme [Talaromyces proteolyticus]|uniref:Pyruvate decarboxylase n=1 Tax=Talaromyces proteolyticus TaxID=1131652 RepID=A0AAD4KEM3_9EURO|nr:thiamine pyrophosphate-requiring enzyme [Talaromyces proteolyticus]KAH8690120.1 thiamine pyrophosphate-requiring enzyme [Talaromyces proteolyticus]
MIIDDVYGQEPSGVEHLESVPRPYNVGRHIAHRIEELGVQDFFVVPGDSNLHLLDHLLENKNLNMVGCCNELNAGYAADGYARTSNAQIAVVVVPYGVGGLSILNAIAGARSENLKVIVISGCPKLSLISEPNLLHHSSGSDGKEVALHAFDQVTAKSLRVTSTESVQDAIDEALKECLDRSLPVYIEIPEDLVQVPCLEPTPLRKGITAISISRDINSALSSIEHAWSLAKRPVLLIGPQACVNLSRTDIDLLASRLGCAVLVQPDARLMTETHPQFCGTFWPNILNHPGERVMSESDLWLVIGGRWSDLHCLGNVDPSKKKSQVIELKSDLVRFPERSEYKVDLQVLIQELLSSEKIQRNDSSLRAYREYQDSSVPTFEAAQDHPDHPGDPITLPSVLRGIQTIFHEGDTLVADAGETWFTSQHIRLPTSASYQVQIVYASIGWGLPATLGCQLARPRNRSILMIGDGAMQMTAQELSTMIHLKLNPVIFVFNNLGYRTETVIHDGPYNYISNWNYAGLGSSLSAQPHAENNNSFLPDHSSGEDDAFFTRQIRTCAELDSALQQVEEEYWKLALLECCIHPDDMTDELRELGKKMSHD